MYSYKSKRIAVELDFELVIITNQDGLGTSSFPEETFWPVQHFIIKTFANEGIRFSKILIDRTLPSEKAVTRKPQTGLLTEYIDHPGYDLPGSFVIGDRITDVQLAKNLGCRAIWLKEDSTLGAAEITGSPEELNDVVVLETDNWEKIYELLGAGRRLIQHERNTHETRISLTLDLDGRGFTNIRTGLHFFDHMLDQLGRHSGIDITLRVSGDLQTDEHHTIEDTGIALGEAFARALGNKTGIERYGFTLPMDDCLAQVAIDFGGRSWLVWDAVFKRERIGDMPTEMFSHFFKSFSDAARCNLNIKAEGENEHHKIESIFKALARAIRQAVKRDTGNMQLPSTKGIL
ncbi:MAG: bifunctional histidinol-phosphatase/imidazoleglycerol-phosphate dehydratase HisB [Chitinophagaceae bacterium]